MVISATPAISSAALPLLPELPTLLTSAAVEQDDRLLPDDPPLPKPDAPKVGATTGQPTWSDNAARKGAAAEFLDTVVDPDELNAYYVLKGSATDKPLSTDEARAKAGLGPKKSYKFNKKQYTNSEVFRAGLLAGGAVEVVLTLVRHPLDTVKTRLQAYNATAVAEQRRRLRAEAVAAAERRAFFASSGVEAPVVATSSRGALARLPPLSPLADLFDSCWDGLRPALLSSIFQGSVFWAVKDVRHAGLRPEPRSDQAEPRLASESCPACSSRARAPRRHSRREALSWLGLTPAQNTIVLRYLAAPPLKTPPLPEWAAALQLDWKMLATIGAVFLGQSCCARGPTPHPAPASNRLPGGPHPARHCTPPPCAPAPHADGPRSARPASDWLVRAPTEIVKVAQQAQRTAEPPPPEAARQPEPQPSKAYLPPAALQMLPAPPAPAAAAVAAALPQLDVRAGLAAFPVFALTDLPVIVTRTYGFLLLRGRCAALGPSSRPPSRPPLAKPRPRLSRAAPVRARGSGAAAALGLSGLDQFSSDLVLYTLASVVANCATTPLEVVRTRLLLQRGAQAAGEAGRTSYEGVLDALVRIREEEGLAALFKGVGVRLLWNGVWVGVFLYVQRVAYLDAQKFSLELVGAADAWAAGFGSSLKELVRFYTT